MSTVSSSTADYLFLKYRSMTVDLMTIAKDYYPHISKSELLRKAGNQDFPFSVFKLDKSKRAPYFVHVSDLAHALDKVHESALDDHTKLHQ